MPPQRSLNALNLHLAPHTQFTSSGYPIIQATHYIPTRIIPFNHIYSVRRTDAAVHFFIDDYQFERIWNFPTRYLPRLQQFNCIFTPDFSLYVDVSPVINQWNTYRSRLIGAWLQQQGLTVIPTISWADEDSHKYCFEGIETAATVAISTIGDHKSRYRTSSWIRHTRAMIDTLRPSTILIYGKPIDMNFGNIQVIYYENEITTRLNKITYDRTRKKIP